MERKDSDELERRCGFLAPWCDILRPRIVVGHPVPGARVGDAPTIPLRLHLPTFHQECRENRTFQQEFQDVREAMTILAAVNHVDSDAWNWLLKKYFADETGKEGEERFETKIKCHFLLYLDLEAVDATNRGYDLVRLCGIDQLENRSAEYLNTMHQIAVLVHPLAVNEVRVPFKIPVTVRFDRLADPLDDRMEEWLDVARAEREIKDQWEGFQQDALPIVPHQGIFALTPMAVDLSGFDLTEKAMRALERLVKDNVWFSSVALYMGMEPKVMSDYLASRVLYYKLVTCIFDRCHRTREFANTPYFFESDATSLNAGQLQLGCLDLWFEESMRACDIEAMCSAMIDNKSTKTLHLNFSLSNNEDAAGCWWKWLAYGLFSKRARASSLLECLSISGLDTLAKQHMTTFARVVASDHPEEDIFETPHGPLDDKNVKVKAGTRIRLHSNDTLVEVSADELLHDESILVGKTFSDDGKSVWVNILVPGAGRCQVERENLVFHEVNTTPATPHRLTALSIEFKPNESARVDGFYAFLAAIGSELKSLSLNIPPQARQEDFNESLILECCPSLQELSISNEVVEISLNFPEDVVHTKSRPELKIEWHNLLWLAANLSDSTNSLSRLTRGLAFCLTARSVDFSTFSEEHDPVDEYADALLSMLQVNQLLEYLEVSTPYDRYMKDFRKHHLKPINRTKAPLALKNKLALLSVVASKGTLAKAAKRTNYDQTARSASNKLDQHVVSRIFAFSAQPVLRRVFYCLVAGRSRPLP